MNKIIQYLFFTAIFLITSCNSSNITANYIVSSLPLQMILQEIVGTVGKVEYIVPVGASPHTYSPKPSDAMKVSKATAFFFVSNQMDGWANNFNIKNKIEIIRLIPKNMLLLKSKFNVTHNDEVDDNTQAKTEDNDYTNYDSHFWTDPVVVKSLVKILIDTLSKIDPQNANLYKSNGEAFINKLDVLDKQVANLLQNIKDKPIFLFHPSFLYLINRYHLTYGGSIERNPGQEASPKFLYDIIEKIKKSGVKAIFSEPQLPDKPAKIIAEQAVVNVYLLDPIGGQNNRMNYNDFLLYNVNKLKEALE
jgi:ABC-type Zn uptake system ZnuABC Zn-binding protein ZnuA